MRIELFWYVTLQYGNLIGLPSDAVSYTQVPEECSPKMVIQVMKYSFSALQETFFHITKITGLI